MCAPRGAGSAPWSDGDQPMGPVVLSSLEVSRAARAKMVAWRVGTPHNNALQPTAPGVFRYYPVLVAKARDLGEQVVAGRRG